MFLKMKLNDFVFVTCLTPSASLTPLRKELFELYKTALLKQTSGNWTVILMGEEDKIEGNFIYIKANTQTKEDKLLELYNILINLEQKPKYLIRLDDDDIFSGTIIDKIERNKLNFDVYVDRYQNMFNVFNLRSLSKEFPWFPSTLIMKFEDAVAKIEYFNNLPLFVCDHDKVFHKHYSSRTVFYSQRNEPIYLRIFSPTSLSFNDSRNKFEKYCNSFGTWTYFSFNGYEWAEKELVKLNQEYFKSTVPNKTIFNLTAGIKDCVKGVLKKLAGR